jgi:DNA-binding beta-propeller fold protein YncE
VTGSARIRLSQQLRVLRDDSGGDERSLGSVVRAAYNGRQASLEGRSGMAIEYSAPDHVRDVVCRLGRSEDIRFSPDNRRLAVAGFNANRIAVFDVEVGEGAVALTGALEVASPSLNGPHGLDFLDDDTIVVANRKADVAVFRLPRRGSSGRHDLMPTEVLRAGPGEALRSPGSVAVLAADGEQRELLICNNFGHSVTRHRTGGPGGAITDEGPLLLQWLNLPDGICVSDDRRWIAVSNHNTHNVLLYEWSERVSVASKPDGVLRGLYFPHGLRFTADGRHLLAADAGAPFIQVYARGQNDWHGTRYPARSIRAMDEAVYRRGRKDPQEGGPKGIDIDRGMTVLAATCEQQSLLFLDLPGLLRDLPEVQAVESVEYEFGVLQQAERLRVKLHDAESRAAKAEHRLRRRKARWLPKPLRRLYSAWKPAN